MFRTCEKYADISRKTSDDRREDAYSFDLVTNHGTDIRSQTYVLSEKEREIANGLEDQLSNALSGNSNLDICVLLSLLNKKVAK